MKKNIFLVMILLISSGVFGQNTQSQNNYQRENYCLVKGDFNNDGQSQELALLEPGYPSGLKITVLKPAACSFNMVSEQTINDYSFPQVNGRIVCGDFNNDGYMNDLAMITNIGVCKTYIIVITFNETWSQPAVFWHGPDFDADQTMFRVASGDFDNDGYIDDVAAIYNYHETRTKIFVWRSTGKEFIWPGTWWVGPDFNAMRVTGTTVSGDFDNDGYIDDIASVYRYTDKSSKIFVWKSNRFAFLWPTTSWYDEYFDVSDIQYRLAAVDSDNDGFTDDLLALETGSQNNLNYLLWNSDKRNFNNPSLAGITSISENDQLTSTPLFYNTEDKRNFFVTLVSSPQTIRIEMSEITSNQAGVSQIWWERPNLFSDRCGNVMAGMEDYNNIKAVRLFPNPAISYLSVSGSMAGPVKVNIYTPDGRIIQSVETIYNGQTIDISNYAAGIYLAVITSGNKTYYQKINIIK